MPETQRENQDEYLISLSALQHYAFCPRQCALIHSEQMWVENLLTAQGRALHERVIRVSRKHARACALSGRCMCRRRSWASAAYWIWWKWKRKQVV
nr:Dna2/Cas4 domain-containing protein [Cardiobacterium valvarum]